MKRIVITWMDGKLTVLKEVREVKKDRTHFKVEGRTSQRFYNAVAIKELEIFEEDE